MQSHALCIISTTTHSQGSQMSTAASLPLLADQTLQFSTFALPGCHTSHRTCQRKPESS